MLKNETGIEWNIIAIGNHVEKGIWGLLIKAINNKKIIINSFKLL